MINLMMVNKMTHIKLQTHHTLYNIYLRVFKFKIVTKNSFFSYKVDLWKSECPTVCFQSCPLPNFPIAAITNSILISANHNSPSRSQDQVKIGNIKCLPDFSFDVTLPQCSLCHSVITQSTSVK